MKNFLSILICLVSLSSFAQTHFQGIQVSANLPAGWKTVQEDYGMIILGHNSTAGMILLVEHGYSSDASILQNIAEGIQEEGVMLAAEGVPQKQTDGTYKGMLVGYADGQQVKAPIRVSRSKTWNAGGVMVAALVRKDLYTESYDKLVNTIMSSLRYKNFTGNAQSKEWKTYLNGSKLQSRSSYDTSSNGSDSYVGVGSSSSMVIHFCSSGQFAAEFSSSSYYGGTGISGDVSSNNTQYSGNWAVLSIKNQVVIRLVHTEGEIEYYPVRHEGGYIYSKDSKYTKDDSNYCR